MYSSPLERFALNLEGTLNAFNPLSGVQGQVQTGSGSSNLTDEEIKKKVGKLKKRFPEGKRWTNMNQYESKSYYYNKSFYGCGCVAFALICSDSVFSNHARKKYKDFHSIKVGDVLRIDNDTHSVFVLDKDEDSVTVCEGNFDKKIHWGRVISREALEKGNFYGETRRAGKKGEEDSKNSKGNYGNNYKKRRSYNH